MIKFGSCKPLIRFASKKAVNGKTPASISDVKELASPPLVNGKVIPDNGTKRSWLRTVSSVLAVPMFVGGVGIALYIKDDNFRSVVTDYGSKIFQSFSVFHRKAWQSLLSNIPGSDQHEPSKTTGSMKDDYQLRRIEDVSSEDLEEAVSTNSMGNNSERPPEPHQAVIVHTLLQQREAKLREEFDEVINERVENLIRPTLVLREKEIFSKLEQHLYEQKKAIENEIAAERASRFERMNEMNKKAVALDVLMNEHDLQLKQSRQAHALVVIANRLDKDLESAIPFTAAWSQLESLKNDQVISAAVNSVPKEIVNRGINSFAQLKTRFKQMSRSYRRAALTSPDAGIFEQLLAAVCSCLLLERNAYDYGSDDFAKIQRAYFFMGQADLQSVVAEIESLDPRGASYDMSRDWLKDAKNRLLVSQTMHLLKLYASELSLNSSRWSSSS
uniref:Mitofilin n=1 Tax=Spongospora subterranea TaxID=70186 RepID=A0A0H5RMX9_9EUKA|eukprot:CRZ10094.1 hypothetical protein [Spongospora subterranea]